MKAYLSCKERAQAEFVEKKSRFIGTIAPVNNEFEAKAFIQSVCDIYKDASHNCFAYVLKGDNTFHEKRFSDDKEPSGTAGRPILEVLEREGVLNVCAVVTRYFGGTLLGAGGLIRAYAKGAKLALDAASIVRFAPYDEIEIVLGYTHWDRAARGLNLLGAELGETDYGEAVKTRLVLCPNKTEEARVILNDICAGEVKFNLLGQTYKPEF